MDGFLNIKSDRNYIYIKGTNFILKKIRKYPHLPSCSHEESSQYTKWLLCQSENQPKNIFTDILSDYF